MKRYVTEYANDLKLKMIQWLNEGVLSKELFLETSDRMDMAIGFCKRGLITSREAVREIMEIFNSLSYKKGVR